MFLNQGELKYQCLQFTAHNYPLDGMRVGNHVRRARVQRLGVCEIAADARAQVGGLADVDDATLFILELVRARAIGN